MHSLMETSRKQFICVKQKGFTQDHQTQFASLSNRFMDSSKHRDNGTRSYMTLSSVWDLNDLNLTAPSTYSFRVMFESLSALTISQLLYPILKELAFHFKLLDLGPPSLLLGVEIVRNPAKPEISLSHRQYIVDALAR